MGKTSRTLHGRRPCLDAPSSTPSPTKTLPGLAQSFGSIIDTLSFPDAIATLCGNDVCLIICEDADTAQKCFEELKNSPHHFSLKNNK